MTALCLLLAVVAFVLFGLATDHHHQQRLGQRLTRGRKRHLRRLAWVGVGACLAAAFAAQGPVYGAVAGLGALSFGAGAVFLFLNLAPAGGPDTKGKPK